MIKLVKFLNKVSADKLFKLHNRSISSLSYLETNNLMNRLCIGTTGTKKWKLSDI